MQKRFLPTSQASKLFNQTTSENPDGATVNEGLSGNTHLLKSADHSVAYKNFTGSQIEDTTLVQEAHNKTIQTDWTEEYDPGVTTTLTETAPNVNQQLTLSKSYSRTHTNLTENINTTNEAHSINVPNWEAYHQSKQVQIPTKLDQTLSGSGSTTVNNLQSQIQTQNINSQNYTHQFGTLNMNGPATVGGNSVQISGSNINIGGAGDTSKIDFTLQKIAEKYFPTPKGQILTNNLPLGVFKTLNYLITAQLDLEIDLNAQNKISVNPITFDKHSWGIDLCQTINNYFADIDIDSADGLENLPNKSPEIGINYSNGTMNFKNGLIIQSQGGYFEVKYITNTDENADNYQDWELHMVSQATLTAKFFPTPPNETSKNNLSIMGQASQDLKEIQIKFENWLSTQMNTPSTQTGATANQMLNEEASADQELAAQGDISNDSDIMITGTGLAAGSYLIQLDNEPLVLRILIFIALGPK